MMAFQKFMYQGPFHHLEYCENHAFHKMAEVGYVQTTTATEEITTFETGLLVFPEEGCY